MASPSLRKGGAFDLFTSRLHPSSRIAVRTGLCPHDLLWRTVTAAMRLIGDRVYLQLGRTPSTGSGRPAAGTVQDPFLQNCTQRHQLRSVTVRAETNQISSMALRALHAMAHTDCHGLSVATGREMCPVRPVTYVSGRSPTTCNSGLLLGQPKGAPIGC